MIKDLTTPQLKAIREILEFGVPATSEVKVTDPLSELSPKSNSSGEINISKEDNNMDEKEIQAMKDKIQQLEDSVKELSEAKETIVAEKTAVETKLSAAEEELTTLRAYKEDAEASKAKAEVIKARKAKIEEAGLDINIEDEPTWIEMSEEIFDFTVANIVKAKGTKESKAEVKIPPVLEPSTQKDVKTIVREGLNELHKKN
jgi:chromosome segregation ATPase